MRLWIPMTLITCALVGTSGATAPPGKAVGVPRLALEPISGARFRFEGELGRRIRENNAQWLIPAPAANPGLLEMFRVRDRQPVPQLVPWAGEFAGKYLISAVQALRMSEDPALRRTTAGVVAELISTQAEDGYLGPFRKQERLRGHWDLWGHYHCILGLLAWHELTGDAAALRSARRAADLVCATYLDTNRRVYDAGSHEMNMAVIHGLGRLYRLTSEPRYLRMMQEIEKDWERSGDYLRTALAGREFYQTPLPRWESLHDLQGLVELYQITGEPKYRQAYEHHWKSILRWDRRNTGGFSSGEQATGDPYSPTAIETCCTVAWMALSLDQLRLTGDARAADELELSTYNAAAGAQHPSGRWWTYSTPMDGTREASAHSIVFQARAGTPELNCCSVNGPRALGMLSEWGVMGDGKGLTVNQYAPGEFRGRVRGDMGVRLRWLTDYPRSGKVVLVVDPVRPTSFSLQLRIPAWSKQSTVQVNGKSVPSPVPGSYLALDRTWKRGDRVTLQLDMALRFAVGSGDAQGKVSLYRGPLLLAYDQRHHAFDDDAIPAVDLKQLSRATVLPPPGPSWVLLTVPTIKGDPLRLCDFAGAGATGTRYRSWLPAEAVPPPPVLTRTPGANSKVAPGALLLRWTGPARMGASVREYRLTLAEDDQLAKPVLQVVGIRTNRFVLEPERARILAPGRKYWWGVTAVNEHGETASGQPPTSFSIDPALPAATVARWTQRERLLEAQLAGEANPAVGILVRAEGVRTVEGPDGRPAGALQLDGRTGRLTYRLDSFPQEEYTVRVRVRFDALPERRLGQVISAWTAPADDPLRLVVEGGKLFARIEAGAGYSTEGVAVKTGRWYSIAAVKDGSQLILYIDGAAAGRATVPFSILSRSTEVALGGNPRFPGNEFLAASFAEFSLEGRAWSLDEVRDKTGMSGRWKDQEMQVVRSGDLRSETADPSLTGWLETISEAGLRAAVEALAYPRHYSAEREANRRAARWIEEQLVSYGYGVQRCGEFDNLLALHPARRKGPAILVGAHYDSVPGSPGADDNGSAVAAMLACARCVAAYAPGTPACFVAFNREEDGLVGSTDFAARTLPTLDFKIREAHVLEMVGFRDRAPGSQKVPSGLPIRISDAGDFLGLVGDQRSHGLLDRVMHGARTYQPELPVAGLKVFFGLEKRIPTLRRSDHAPFWDAAIPALMWTDTAEFRNPHYHHATDTPETLDYEFLRAVTIVLTARVLAGQ